jgi:hypothetical protein
MLDDMYLLFITFIYIWYRISDAGAYCCRLHNGDINSQVVFTDSSTVELLKASHLGQRKIVLLTKTGDLLKEVQFIWNCLTGRVKNDLLIQVTA